MRRLGDQAEVVLGHDPGHQLALKMVAEVRRDRPVEQLDGLPRLQPQVRDGRVEGLLDDRLERLVGARLGELADPAGKAKRVPGITETVR